MRKFVTYFCCLVIVVGSLPVDAQKVHTAPAPLYRDPVTDGAADPVVIWNNVKKCWCMFYTQRRANLDAADVAYCYGTKIGVAESDDHGQTWVYKGTLDLDFEEGVNTFWAPDVVFDSGKYHMFVSYIPGVRNHWGGTHRIMHYVSLDLWHWKYAGKLQLSSDAVIDPTLYRKQDGTWRLWYKDESAGSHTFVVESRNLYNWSEPKLAVGGEAHEGPKVFRYDGCYWMLTDEWKGLRVYRSEDLEHWEKQGLILDKPSLRSEDTPSGAHADVLVVDDRAYVFYFTHPGRTSHVDSPADENGVIPYKFRRSSIQVAPLISSSGTLVCDRNTEFDFYLPDMK